MLVLTNIEKNFGKTTALQNISLEIKPGNVTGILGQNGAGKTTLLRIIGGLLRQDRGSVQYDNRFLSQSMIGLLLGGDVGLYDKLTARENILYFAKIHGIDLLEAEKRLEELAAEFSLTPYLDRYAGELSRGTKQKASIIRAVIHNPKVILFDEPETGLDFDAAKSISDFLIRCAANGKTVIYSSHSIGNILAVCYEAYILHHGKMVNFCNVREIQRNYTSAEAQELIYSIVNNHEGKN